MSVELASPATNAWGLACCIWVVNAAQASRRTFPLLLIQLHIRESMPRIPRRTTAPKQLVRFVICKTDAKLQAAVEKLEAYFPKPS